MIVRLSMRKISRVIVMSENQKVLKYLKSGKSITCFKAIKLGLTYNLRSRISNIIDMGHSVKKSWVSVKRSDGEMARVRSYSL